MNYTCAMVCTALWWIDSKNLQSSELIPEAMFADLGHFSARVSKGRHIMRSSSRVSNFISYNRRLDFFLALGLL